MSFSHKIRTRYSETGQDGIIHHSAYVVYLEEARCEFFKTLGCDVNWIEQNKTFCPVIDLSLKYLKPLRSLEDIVIEVSVEAVSRVRFSLHYTIFREKECIVKGVVTNCFLNEAFKPIGIPEKVLESLKKA